jgi:cell division transport system permease protein
MPRRNTDDLGLRRALGGGIVPVLVGAMAFLAALAGAGAVGAQAVARQWQMGAGGALTIQVPQPDDPAAAGAGGETRMQRALRLLRADPAIATANPLSKAQLAALLRPWFGEQNPPPELPIPGVIAASVRVDPAAPASALAELGVQLAGAVPGAVLEQPAQWTSRIAALADSLEACALLVLAIVAAVAALVVVVATRTGLLARRETIRIVHGLGATDGYIAARFARRATALAAGGAVIGAIAALPLVLTLASVAAPLQGEGAAAPSTWWSASVWGLPAALPVELWVALPALPLAAALIGFATAQGTVRGWLRRLP